MKTILHRPMLGMPAALLLAGFLALSLPRTGHADMAQCEEDARARYDTCMDGCDDMRDMGMGVCAASESACVAGCAGSESPDYCLDQCATARQACEEDVRLRYVDCKGAGNYEASGCLYGYNQDIRSCRSTYACELCGDPNNTDNCSFSNQCGVGNPDDEGNYQVLCLNAGLPPETEDGRICWDRLTHYCGNGILEPEEECDDGNRADGDGCSNACRFEVCGDGIVQANEVCDDGNTADGDACSADCGKIDVCYNVDCGDLCCQATLNSWNGTEYPQCVNCGGDVPPTPWPTPTPPGPQPSPSDPDPTPPADPPAPSPSPTPVVPPSDPTPDPGPIKPDDPRRTPSPSPSSSPSPTPGPSGTPSPSPEPSPKGPIVIPREVCCELECPEGEILHCPECICVTPGQEEEDLSGWIWDGSKGNIEHGWPTESERRSAAEFSAAHELALLGGPFSLSSEEGADSIPGGGAYISLAFEGSTTGIRTAAAPARLPVLPGPGADVQKLALYWLSPGGTWTRVAEQSIEDGALRARVIRYGLYQVFAQAADSTFDFGNVYVFPNPTTEGNPGTLHIEIPQPQSMKVRIYDIAGDLVLEMAVNVPPVILDGKTSYEMPLDGSKFGRGVYVGHVIAQRAGHGTLQKKFTFSVRK